MNRRLIASAWYGELLPSGAFCATVPHQHIATHRGNVSLPPNEPFGIVLPRCTDVGSFRFAGQAHGTIEPACWEYDGAGWAPYPQPCVGVNAVIYDRLGVLHRSDGSVGSQGYRYVTPSNQIVSGDATYGPSHGLFEYTDLGGLWIGQAAYDGGGVQVWDGATLRQLELGYCVFVRANRDGETVALSFFDGELNGVVNILTTMAELRALPPVPTVGTPVPNPGTPPPPQPKPTPEPVPMSLDIVKRVRAKYPTPLGDQHWRFLVEVAQATGAQLYRKEAGDNVLIPPLGKRVSMDVIGRGALGNVWVDILGDAEGDAVPAWDAHPNAAGEYVDVSGIVLNPPQPPTDPPPSPPGDVAALAARIAAVEARISRLVKALHEA